MEAAIRWSTRNQQDATRRFLIADVAKNCLQHGEVEEVRNGFVKHRTISRREKLPNFTAFDWSRDNDSLVAIGTSVGECRIISLDPGHSNPEVLSLPVKFQRKCNSLSFSRDDQLAVGLDRIRGDTSLNIYDLPSQNKEPVRRLTGAEVITNVKYFSDQPQTLIAGSGGIARYGQSLKLYDLREQVSATVITVPTRHVHVISLDPLDENYIASAGPASENVLSVWDKRRMSNMETAGSPGLVSPAVLEMGSVLSHTANPSVWSLRYSGYRRGAFAALSADGQIRYFETAKMSSEHYDSDHLFVKRSHSIRATNVDDGDQVIGFDHASPGGLENTDALLTIRQSRQLWTANVNLHVPRAGLTATGTAALSSGSSTFMCSVRKRRKSTVKSQSSLEPDTNPRSHMTGEATHLSSWERHRRFIDEAHNHSKADLSQALRLADVQRQRCLAGYLFDCEKNIRIVKEDPWLVELWDTIRRLKRMAANQGMVQQGANLSYFGVYDLWHGSFENRARRLRRPPPAQEEFTRLVKGILARHSYSDFEGVDTKHPSRRQLALAVCGWKFDERGLRTKCSDIISRKEYYKAIVVAVAHGRRDIAIELVRSLTRTKAIENSALAAVVSGPAISDDQRSLCDWMAEEAEDPYLKALLAYYVSGSWRSVVEMVELPLQYRIAIALKYVDDDTLTQFLSQSLSEVTERGDTEGIILTGLTDSAIDLFQNYIARFNDLQTPVLAMSSTSPHLVRDASRWETWKTTYFDLMQAWSAFLERTQFGSEHRVIVDQQSKANRSAPKDGQENQSTTLQCTHCNKSISVKINDDLATDKSLPPQRAKRSALNNGMLCPRCGRHFSRCVICMHWQGSPKFKIPGPSESAMDNSFMAKLIGICIRCKHGFHLHHAREWFARHERCPVTGCSCRCDIPTAPLSMPAG